MGNGNGPGEWAGRKLTKHLQAMASIEYAFSPEGWAEGGNSHWEAYGEAFPQLEAGRVDLQHIINIAERHGIREGVLRMRRSHWLGMSWDRRKNSRKKKASDVPALSPRLSHLSDDEIAELARRAYQPGLAPTLLESVLYKATEAAQQTLEAAHASCDLDQAHEDHTVLRQLREALNRAERAYGKSQMHTWDYEVYTGKPPPWVGD